MEIGWNLPKEHNTDTMPLTYTKNAEGDFVCPDCGVVKKNQSSMHYHIKRHQKAHDYECPVCQKGFLQKQTLQLHIASKHPEQLEEKEQKKFVCPMEDCSFSSLSKGNCVIHCLRVHFQKETHEYLCADAATKTWNCTKCEKEFHSGTSYYYHCKDCLTFNKKDPKVKLYMKLL